MILESKVELVKEPWTVVENDAKLPKESCDRARNSLCLENVSSKISRRVELTFMGTLYLFFLN